MVCINDINVRLQNKKPINYQWTTCDEFESHETVKSNANSGSRKTTVVECTRGLFRFNVSLVDFKWLQNANAIKINVTFDEDDPIKDHEIVVLRPARVGDSVQMLGLETLKVADTGELTYCLETISRPLTEEDPSSNWHQVWFEFKRYPTDTTNSDDGRPAPKSKSKGTLRIDITQCIVEKNPRRNVRIALTSKLDSNWRSLPPADNVTLKPELRFEPSRICNAYRHYKCKPLPKVDCISFIFLYREAGHYERIEEENIEIVGNEGTSASKASQRSKRLATPRSRSSSQTESLDLTATRKPSRDPRYSSQSLRSASNTPACPRSQTPSHNALAPPTGPAPVPENSSCDIAGGRLQDDGGLTPLVGATTQIRLEIDKMERKANEAQKMIAQKKLQQATDEMIEAQIVLDNCKSEVDSWRGEDERITKRIQNFDQQYSGDELDKEERAIHQEVKRAVQKLHDYRSQKLETRKREVSQLTTGSSSGSPIRATKKAR